MAAPRTIADADAGLPPAYVEFPELQGGAVEDQQFHLRHKRPQMAACG
jgi:hypothetical protein